MESSFSRGLSERFLDLLRAEAAQGGWWRDVLADQSLIIAIRRECLDVYWQGQSLFNVTLKGSGLIVTTHMKYLLDPGLGDRVRLVGGDFRIDELVRRAFLREYHSPSSLAKLKKSASYYGGDEKRGVHDIVLNNRNVIDVEIAFPGLYRLEDESEGDETRDPRIDVAALQADGDDIQLMFWEAKTYQNPALRTSDIRKSVVRQVRIYEDCLKRNRQAILRAIDRSPGT